MSCLHVVLVHRNAKDNCRNILKTTRPSHQQQTHTYTHTHTHPHIYTHETQHFEQTQQNKQQSDATYQCAHFLRSERWPPTSTIRKCSSFTSNSVSWMPVVRARQRNTSVNNKMTLQSMTQRTQNLTKHKQRAFLTICGRHEARHGDAINIVHDILRGVGQLKLRSAPKDYKGNTLANNERAHTSTTSTVTQSLTGLNGRIVPELLELSSHFLCK